MPEIDYINPQINTIKNQEIYFQVSNSGFSFLIRSAEDKKCLLMRHYEFKNVLLIDELIRKVEQIISVDTQIGSKFVKAEVTFISQGSTLIPQEFFKPEYLKKYFEFSYNLDELDELHYTFIPCITAYNLFSLPNYLSQVFYTLHPNIKFNHQATQLINYGNSLVVNNLPLLIIGLNKGFFDICIFENKKLVLSNSFQYTNATDLAYFLIYTCKQLKIDLEKINTYIAGEAISEHKFIDEIAQYVNEVIVPDIKTVSVCSNLTSTSIARFYNLFLID
jgi:hypothetical protein